MAEISEDFLQCGRERMLADPRPTDALIAAALLGPRSEHAEAEHAFDLNAYSPAALLMERGTHDVLEAALLLCDSAQPLKRDLGARILGQLGSPRTFPEECCDRLLRFLAQEEDLEVLATALFAFGHLGNHRADPEIAKLKNHSADSIRHGVAFALADTVDPDGVRALLELMRDPHTLARDWATTSIGQTVQLDTPEIRNALFERLCDDDRATRAEAHRGLACRHDERLLAYLIAELELEFGPSSPDRDEDYDCYFRDAAKIYLEIDEESEVGAPELVFGLKALVSKVS
jgi:HEAT repeat protein